MRSLIVLLVACGILGAFTLQRQRVESQLLRADPDRIPFDSRLMGFALGKGHSQFDKHCSSCHGAEAKGNSNLGIPNLVDDDWLYGAGSVSDIERVAEYGIRSYDPKAWNLARMPAYARLHPSASEPKIPPLAPNQIRDVIAFLLYQQRQDADADAVARGAQIYSNVGGCYDCHGADARGDPAIGAPNLTDRITLYGDGSPQALFDSIAYGRQGICPAWVNKLSPVAIREIALYVYSLTPHAAKPPDGGTHQG